MRGTLAGVKTTDLENTINLMLVYRNDSFQTNIDRMTIDVVFMAKNKVVFRVNMCYSNFASKILDEQPIKERWIPGFDGDDQTFTDQEFMEKVWYACVQHGYISEDYDIMGKLINTMKIML